MPQINTTLEAFRADVTKGIRYITEIGHQLINSMQIFSLYLKDDQ